MSSSYENINYSLRPAKTIERKMLCEAFRRMSPFGSVETYKYVGFGSPYFSDFILFHKVLNIFNMTSIEKDVEKKERFNFNKPFKCIDMIFGDSNEVLPGLSWDQRSIVWLDYDGKLDESALADIRFLSASCISGSLFMFSVNASPDNDSIVEVENLPNYRLQMLEDQVGSEKVPLGIKGTDLAGWGKAAILRKIVENEINQTLNERNGGRENGAKLCYRPLFNFQYSDGAKMLTVGGVLYDEGQTHILNSCSFIDLPYITDASEKYRIEVPSLTFKEIRHLDEQLPRNESDTLSAPAVPIRDIRKYENIYRYFPAFVETNL